MKPVALITGASRGIGRVIVQQLAYDGYDIIALARDEIKLNQIVREFRNKKDTRIFPIVSDLDDFESSAAHVKSILESIGHLNVLVHSAGIFRFGTGEVSMEDLQALLSTNVIAVHNINQVALPYLRVAPKSYLFAISSITGVQPFAPVGGYASSKHALVGYIRSLALQERKNGVHVTVICPDVVDTDMAAMSGICRSQRIEPEDLAKTIRFVMSLSSAVMLDQIVIGCDRDRRFELE